MVPLCPSLRRFDRLLFVRADAGILMEEAAEVLVMARARTMQPSAVISECTCITGHTLTSDEPRVRQTMFILSTNASHELALLTTRGFVGIFTSNLCLSGRLMHSNTAEGR